MSDRPTLIPPVMEGPAAFGRTMTPWEQFVSRIKYALIRFRRKLPHLVWWDDEVDVTVTIKEFGGLGKDPGKVWEASKALRDMGIGFDAGSDCHGRDWEWDWSLSGPISVRFRSRAQRPELRTAVPPKSKPKLKIVSGTDNKE